LFERTFPHLKARAGTWEPAEPEEHRRTDDDELTGFAGGPD